MKYLYCKITSCRNGTALFKDWQLRPNHEITLMSHIFAQTNTVSCPILVSAIFPSPIINHVSAAANLKLKPILISSFRVFPMIVNHLLQVTWEWICSKLWSYLETNKTMMSCWWQWQLWLTLRAMHMLRII